MSSRAPSLTRQGLSNPSCCASKSGSRIAISESPWGENYDFLCRLPMTAIESPCGRQRLHSLSIFHSMPTGLYVSQSFGALLWPGSLCFRRSATLENTVAYQSRSLTPDGCARLPTRARRRGQGPSHTGWKSSMTSSHITNLSCPSPTAYGPTSRVHPASSQCFASGHLALCGWLLNRDRYTPSSIWTTCTTALPVQGAHASGPLNRL